MKKTKSSPAHKPLRSLAAELNTTESRLVDLLISEGLLAYDKVRSRHIPSFKAIQDGLAVKQEENSWAVWSWNIELVRNLLSE